MFKKRDNEDRVKHMELTENRTEEVGVFTRFIRVIIKKSELGKSELGGCKGANVLRF
jgi:hypothetical protein